MDIYWYVSFGWRAFVLGVPAEGVMMRWYIIFLSFCCPALSFADYAKVGDYYYVFEGDGQPYVWQITPLTIDWETLDYAYRVCAGFAGVGHARFTYVKDGIPYDYVCVSDPWGIFDSVHAEAISRGLLPDTLVYTELRVWPWTCTPDDVGGDGINVEAVTPYVTYYAQCVEWCFVGLCLFLGLELYIAFMQRR